MVAAAILFSAGPASAAEELRQLRRGDEILLDTYYRLEAKLEKNSFGFPLFLESSESDDRVPCGYLWDLRSFLQQRSQRAQDSGELVRYRIPRSNVKLCTYREQPGSWLLTLYFGRKTYQPQEDMRQVIYHYRPVEQRQEYLDILLDAAEGPFGTRTTG